MHKNFGNGILGPRPGKKACVSGRSKKLRLYLSDLCRAATNGNGGFIIDSFTERELV
jgi:hypothetical protein